MSFGAKLHYVVHTAAVLVIHMGSESGSSRDDRDEDDEDECEEDGGNRLLGFMFGNVDGAGDLDVDYLDEDAKEHFAALADKLGSSLTEFDLSVKSVHARADVAEQDYDEKAEDAVDYEDIDEQYEGPEIQATTEEDYLLPKKEFFSAGVSMATLEHRTSVFDDENYDDDDDEYLDKEHESVDTTSEVQNIPSPGKRHDTLPIISEEEIYLRGDLLPASLGKETTDFQEEEPEVLEELPDDSNPLPVLYTEDGTVILRFSEIFGNYEPLKKGEKKERKYEVLKEKYITTDTSDIVEEDDEDFLKGYFRGFSFPNHAHALEEESLGNLDKELHAEKYGFVDSALTPTAQDERRLEVYHSAQPMKEDVKLDLSAEWSSCLSPNGFFPLDQQNWEDKIIWDNSPAESDNAAESFETSGHDSEDVSFIQTENESSPKEFWQELETKLNGGDHSSFLHNRPVIVESFVSTEFPVLRNELSSESCHHPQILRLGSRLELASDLDGRKDDVTSEEIRQSDAMKRFSKLTLQNRDLIEGSWLERIIWEPQQSIDRPKLIVDLQDEHMPFELKGSKNGQDIPLHAGAMIIARSMNPNIGDLLEPLGHGTLSTAQFNIANDKFYTSRKISQQLKLHSKKRASHGIKVLHSVPANKLQTMKPKLSNKDIANFHRPKALWYPHDNEVALKEQGKLTTQGPMKIILKSLGGKGSKLHVDAEETVSSVKLKASKKLDYKPLEAVKIYYSGRELEDEKSLAAQDVRPNSLLHLVRSSIYLWPRAQRVPGENKSLRPPGAFKKKSDLSVKDGHVFLMEYCEERPLLLGNAGMGARLCTYYQKTASDDQTGYVMRNGNKGLGSLFQLDPADKSPFLGDITVGSTQSSLETNMYRSPIYPHKVSSTDYLLVRSSKGKLSIRRIDRLNVVGQQEPHMDVMSPGSKNVQTYIMNRLLVYMYREFRALQKRGSLPCIRADELSAQFPTLAETFLRKRLKHCADLQRVRNGQQFWMMRRNFQIPLEEELRRMVTPENVCAYESMQAGQYRLKRLGITRLSLSAGLSSAMNQLPDEAITLAAASHIERELQITPWNLSSNFVACTSQDRDNIERLEISGVGDPSGRGLGFSFVRATPKAPVSNAMLKKKATVSRGGSTVTGTDSDLRRLSMEAAREVLIKFNVPEEQIARQSRWHRIAMIRKLSSEQATAGIMVDASTISKYARGQRMSFLQLQQQTREKCQEIWDRQVQSLSAVDGDEYESDIEAHSDLDSFAGDLENLLDAEECEEGEGEEGNYLFKHSKKSDSVKGQKMRRRLLLAQAEEEIEDEAAEAAELCRMLMDDDEAELKMKKKTKAAGEGVARTLSSQLNVGMKSADQAKKTSVTPKKVDDTIQPIALCASREISTQESEKEETRQAKKSFSTKIKPMKTNHDDTMGSLNKKVKILADGVQVTDGSQFVKEKKSAREKFVCGACGQLGHMRTNKNCPKFREDLETEPEGTDQEKTTRSDALDPISQIPKKAMPKKLVQKIATNMDQMDAPDDEKSSLKAKVLKVKCGASDKLTPASSQGLDTQVLSDAEAGNEPTPKVNKIIFSNKTKSDSVQVVPHKTTIVIKPPVEEKEQLRKIVIKRPKEIINLEESSAEGGASREVRKMKKINEISSFENQSFLEESAREKRREEKRYWEEEEKRRIAEREKEERTMRLHIEHKRMLEEQEKLAAIKRYELAIKKEREEEEQQKAKNKKKKKQTEMSENYLDDFQPRRNDKKQPEKDRISKRRPNVELGRYGAEHVPPTKRRKGGEVGLANILENIVEILKDNHEVSYLFLKPVTKKEAPDYYKIIEHPMDLSTIKQKVRRLEYKSREEFRHDVWQISMNANEYNVGRNPGIPPLAMQLLELCDYLIEDNREALDEAEAGIEYIDS